MVQVFRLFLAVCMLAFFMALDTSDVSAHEPESAEFVVTIGAQTGPFDTGTGFLFAGEIGLPLMDAGPGRILGLVNISLAKTDDDITFEPTAAALGLPTQHSVDLTTVSIIMGLKYKLMANNTFQPYIMGGPGINIFLNDSDPGDTVGGIAPQPKELQDKGYPDGQGDAEFGLHVGGGLDINITPKIFVGAEARYNWVDQENGSFGTYGGRLGFRF